MKFLCFIKVKFKHEVKEKHQS